MTSKQAGREEQKIIFQNFDHSTILYGAAAWSHAVTTNYKKIQVVQNKALKTTVAMREREREKREREEREERELYGRSEKTNYHQKRLGDPNC